MADPQHAPAPLPPTTPPTTPPPGRYGGARRQLDRRTWVAVVVVAAVLVAAWSAWAALRDDVQWKDVGFHVDGTTAVDVTFDVTKPREATVTCTVQALAESYAQVGVRTVEVGPADTATQRLRVRVATTQQAVTGVVESCSHARR